LFALKLEEVWQQKDLLQGLGLKAFETINEKVDAIPEQKFTDIVLDSLNSNR
jgi:hypothetical protein